MLTQAQILAAIRDCYDPELRLNLVVLGRVADVQLTLDADAPGAGIPGVPQRFRVTVTLLGDASQDGQLSDADQLRAALVRNRLAGVEQLSRIEVNTQQEPPWTPSRISSAARQQLGLDAAPFSILNNRRP